MSQNSTSPKQRQEPNCMPTLPGVRGEALHRVYEASCTVFHVHRLFLQWKLCFAGVEAVRQGGLQARPAEAGFLYGSDMHVKEATHTR